MSNRYKGGIISATPPTTSGPYADGAASGAWTLEQQMQVTAAGTWPTAGNIDPANIYIEYLFSTYLYTGNGSTQTITNGIDLAGEGGMVWGKCRNEAFSNVVYDTNRGVNKALVTNATSAEYNSAGQVTSFNTNGFSVGDYLGLNGSGYNYASWTFRKQPKFFDVQTWTGNAVQGRILNHSLGSVPGCIIVKCTSSSGTDWVVHHQALGFTKVLYLNSTLAADTTTRIMGATSTTFTVSDASSLNSNGNTYVAYLFAHDAGGFGLTGTDNVISCGSFTHNSTSGVDVNLGYEPQWILQKNAGAASGWLLIDNMRGWVVDANDQYLTANSSGVEDNIVNSSPTATGFKVDAGAWGNGANIIYIAIRRGPMKVPTSGTSVYNAVARTGTGATAVVNTTITADAFLIDRRNSAGNAWGELSSRLTGASKSLWTTQTYAEITDTTEISNIGMDSITLGTSGTVNSTAGTYINWFFKRAPSFFDVVCYTGNGSVPQTVPHNLGVVPELMIVKNRSDVTNWATYNATNGPNYYMNLNSTAAAAAQIDRWRNTAPTSTNFYVGATNNVSGNNYVAYLFATCAGVSKVGSYTGTGTTKQVDCGFTSGARFVLIKRTDSTGDWYVWDSARGIVAGNDPYLLLNSTAAEVTSTDYVDTYSAGFEISSTAPAAINASGGTFIFLAIA